MKESWVKQMTVFGILVTELGKHNSAEHTVDVADAITTLLVKNEDLRIAIGSLQMAMSLETERDTE